MTSKSPSDGFVTFLEAVKRPASVPKPADHAASSGHSEVKRTVKLGRLSQELNAASRKILSTLNESAPLKVTDLLEKSRLSYDVFTVTLNKMKVRGYVTVQGKPGEQIARLTPSGRTIIRTTPSDSQ